MNIDTEDRLYVWQLAEVTGRERYDVVAWLREKHFSITRPRGESMAKAWVSKAGFTDYLYHG